MSEPDGSPSRVGVLLSIGAGVVALGMIGVYGVLTATAGSVGLLVLTVGVLRGSRRAITVGAFALFVGVLLAGLEGAPPLWILVGAVGTVLAWDIGENAVGIGEQLGGDAETVRLEAVHAATSLGVGAVTVVASYGIYTVAGGGQPLSTLVFLLIAVVALTLALRP